MRKRATSLLNAHMRAASWFHRAMMFHCAASRGDAVRAQMACAVSGTCAPAPAVCTCGDIAPGDQFTCTQQASGCSLHACWRTKSCLQCPRILCPSL